MDTIKERLTKNAEDFDQIITDICEYNKNLEIQNKEYKDTIDIIKGLLKPIVD